MKEVAFELVGSLNIYQEEKEQGNSRQRGQCQQLHGGQGMNGGGISEGRTLMALFYLKNIFPSLSSQLLSSI